MTKEMEDYIENLFFKFNKKYDIDTQEKRIKYLKLSKLKGAKKFKKDNINFIEVKLYFIMM